MKPAFFPVIMGGRRGSVAQAFTPASLFTSGVQGAWYDPSDYSSLFQDSAGTTPVTAVEQPVGLMLDKSQGATLGSELVTNGDFSNGTTSWTNSSTGTGTFTVSGGVASLVGTDASNRGVMGQAFTTVVGRAYVLTFTASAVSGATLYGASTGAGYSFSLGGGSIPSGSVRFQFVATTTTTYVNFAAAVSSAGAASIDNVSVKDLIGNHASQATTASRPVLRARYNLLTYSEQFDNAGWTKGNATITANATTAPDGTATADLAVATVTSGTHTVQQNTIAVSGGTGTISWRVKPAGYSKAGIRESTTTGFWSAFDLTGAGSVIAKHASVTATISLLNDDWYLITQTTSGATSQGSCIHVLDSGYTSGSPNSYSFAGDGTSGIYIWGADLRYGSSAGTYQRIAAATDYATAGFLPYLAADGADDNMVIPAAAISGATAMTECHGGWRPTGFAASNGVVFGGIGTGLTNDHEPFSDNVLYYGFASTARQDFGSLGTVTTPYILDATQTGTTLVAFKNNAQLSTTKTVALGIGTTPRLFVSNNATLQYYAGNMFGGVLIQKVLSASEMTSLRNYMAAKSGVTL
jgi:hypothetical protein